MLIKTFIYTLVVLIGFQLLLASPALAQNKNAYDWGDFEAAPPPLTKNADIDNIAKQEGLVGYIGIVVNLVTAIIVVVGLILVIVGGYFYMTAGGSADRVNLAKTIIGSALLGIVLALGAVLLLNTINPELARDAKEPDINEQGN